MIERIRSLVGDLRVAARSLKRAPMFSLLVVATLGIGIGVNSTMFSVVDAILLRPLSYPDAERLVLVGISAEGWASDGVSTYGHRPWEYWALAEGAETFESLGVYVYGGGTLTGDGGYPEEPTSLSVDCGLLETVRLSPLIGRLFSEQDCAEDAEEEVVMLGEELWRRRYNADDGILGREILLDEVPHRVVGIVPDSFRFPEELDSIQVYRVLNVPRDDSFWSLGLVARLAPQTDQAEADEEVAAIAAGLAEERPDTNEGRSFFVRPLQEDVVGGVETPLYLLWGAVGFVLLLACMNAANMLLARSAAKVHEMGVSAALGASRSRIMQRVLSESLLLSAAGGVVGLLIALWGIEAIANLGMTNLPRGEEIGLDGRVFAFTAGLSLLAGLAYGLLPAFEVSRVDLTEVMKEGTARASAGRARQRLRAALTVGEVAIAVVLLIGAGLMIRSSLEIRGTDPGFDHDNVLGLTMWADQPRDAGAEWTERFYDEILEDIDALPGVQQASMINCMPWQSIFSFSTEMSIADHPDFADGEPQNVKYRIVSEDHLEEMGIPLLAGRWLERSDDSEAPEVVLVSDAFVDAYYPDGDAVGRTLMIGDDDPTPVEIVGVVGDVRERRLTRAPDPILYFAYRQNRTIAMTLMVRTEGDPSLLERPVQQAIWAVSPTQGIWRTRTLDSMLDTTLARETLYRNLLTIFAGVAVLLAAIGVYGVISYSVTQRTREIGIRMALGADRGQILRDVLLRGLRLAAIGLLLGLPAAFGVARLLKTLLYQVAPLDLATYGVVALGLVAVAALACWVPALRATRVPPTVCLRLD